MTNTLIRTDGTRLVYDRLEAQTGNSGPGIVFLCGFGSDKEGSKALFLEEQAKKTGQAFVRFDYSGHGQSDGDFKDGTISAWAADTLAVIDELTEGPQILVGSSMGGWLMLLAALARKDRIAGLVGIAAAPDFTKRMQWPKLTPEQQAIVAAPLGHYVVRAVAGSGKTTTLAYRIKALLDRGLDARRILVLMFNKSAQLDFQAKLNRIITQGTTPPEVRTFHAMGFRLYRRFIELGALPTYQGNILSEREIQFHLLQLTKASYLIQQEQDMFQ